MRLYPTNPEEAEKAPGIFIHTSSSRDESLVRISVPGDPFKTSAAGAALIRETSASNGEEPYVFCGQHAGMPKFEFWAMTTDGSPIDRHVGEIAVRVGERLQSNSW